MATVHDRWPSVALTMVPLTQAELRETQLALLDTFAEFCQQRDLRFYLCAGTLLGAVRHRAYIPWDDDIDVMMPRPDYATLVSTFEAANTRDHVALLNTRGAEDSYPYPYAKLTDNRTMLREHHASAVDMGVNIDIFPLDGWPSGRGRQALHRHRIRFHLHVLQIKAAAPKRRSLLLDAYLRFARFLTSPISVGGLVQRLSTLAASWAFDESVWAGVTIWGYHEAVPTRCYGEASTVEFEGRHLPAPADPDAILRRLFDDYWTLPPPSQQVSHHSFDAYRGDDRLHDDD